MGAVWVLLAKTRFPAELIESSPEEGVRTISLPFEIAADYIPSRDIESDDEVKFREVQGDLRISGFGVTVRGMASSGTLQLFTDDGAVILENQSGATRIEGNELRVSIKSDPDTALVLIEALILRLADTLNQLEEAKRLVS